ncbi:MAG TPA: right-handed parallel beta-helix repeat-containing protein, partial [Armatimonadota bacterium]|nr:right-handed parallel beta-helix repeat-containing protein [Armatimonadota bacterium]
MNRRSIFQFAAVAACALSVSMVRGAPSSIRMVTNTADAGPGSLREAIVWADIHPGTVIRFKIPSETAAGRGSLPIIKPLSPLPIISGARTVIDGTAPATAGPVKRITPGVVINGAQIAPKACGLHLEAAQCVIKGLVINGFSGSGIELFGPHTSENRVEGCFIGTDPTGDRGDGNRSHGIDIALGANHNAIGGTAPGAGNVVSGNGDRGVKLFGAGADDNVVEGNIIGANAAGDAAVMNGKNGVDIDGGAKNNIIGGAAPGARNIISGNGERGVLIASPGTNSNSVAGNFIGTNAAGTAAIPNHAYGIDIEGMS